MNKILKVLIVISITAISIVGCGNAEGEDISAGEPLIIGMELAYPPFETKDDAGNPSGVSVDLANALGEHLDRPIKIENTNWDGLIPSLQTGKVDVVISSMTITDERKEVVDFSIPYSRAYLALLVNKESGITEAEDLNKDGKIIGVKKGTIGPVYAAKYLEKAKVNALTSENAGVTEVLQGKADAFVFDQLTVYRQNQRNKDKTDVVQIPAQDSEDWGMVVKKGNDQLLEEINNFIGKYKADGGFDELADKYMKEEKRIFEELGFPWFFD